MYASIKLFTKTWFIGFTKLWKTLFDCKININSIYKLLRENAESFIISEQKNNDVNSEAEIHDPHIFASGNEVDASKPTKLMSSRYSNIPPSTTTEKTQG